MAPLDLDKYAEIAKQCKYLPENDLKVSAALCLVPENASTLQYRHTSLLIFSEAASLDIGSSG